MPKPACIPCGRFFRPHKNGARVMECMPITGRAPSGSEHAACWTDYKLWLCDLWRCDGCGAQISVGYGLNPLAEHYQNSFDAEKKQATMIMGGKLPTIYDC